ncbi:MAG: alternative ribosome rescue aminoacyl-tRNA hydrolase ArfB [Bacteroidota bacterium]
MDKKIVLGELKFQAARSSGPGGQHVNKVSSKVVLCFNIEASGGLTTTEKERLVKRLSGRLNKKGLLVLQCDETRSQHKNKGILTKRFLDILQSNLKVPKKRRPTTPSKSAIEKRLQSKKIASKKKANRKPPDF